MPFSESPYAWKGPFRQTYVPASTSTRYDPCRVPPPPPKAVTPGLTSGTAILNEVLTIGAMNVIPQLSAMPDGQMTFLYVNGRAFAAVTGAFTVSGVAVTWTHPYYSVNPGDEVVACFTYVATLT